MLSWQEHGGAGNDNTSECLILFAFSQGTRNGFVAEHVLKGFTGIIIYRHVYDNIRKTWRKCKCIICRVNVECRYIYGMVYPCQSHSPIGLFSTSVLGIQNGITRRCLSLPICTTHFTGYLTDVGTGLGLWARETLNGNNPPTLLKAEGQGG